MSSGYSIYRYSEVRDKSVLIEMCRIHNSVFRYDTVDPDSYLRFVLEDPNSREDAILIAMDSRGGVLGYLVGVDISKEPPEVVDRYKDTVWVKDFAVSLDLGVEMWRKIGLELFEKFRRDAKDLGKKNITLYAYAPFYFMPGVNILYEDYLEFFEEIGFRKVSENVNYEVDLTQFYYPRRVLRLEEKTKGERGLVIRFLGEDEASYVVKWVKEVFDNPFWGMEVLYTLKVKQPSVLLAEVSGSLVGFAVFSRIGRNEFGPTGVDPRYRGLGIGTILLFKALNEMKLAGYRYAVITWTTHLFFYTQVPGITRVKHYLVLSSAV